MFGGGDTSIDHPKCESASRSREVSFIAVRMAEPKVSVEPPVSGSELTYGVYEPVLEILLIVGTEVACLRRWHSKLGNLETRKLDLAGWPGAATVELIAEIGRVLREFEAGDST